MESHPRRKKVLYVITLSNVGGAQHYVYDLAVHLPRDDFDVAVAAGMGGGGALLSRLDREGVRTIVVTHLVRSISPYHDIRAYLELVRLFRSERPDVVHLNSSKVSILGSLAAHRARVPRVVYTVHGSVFEASFPWLARRLFRVLERATALWKDYIITITENDRRLWCAFSLAPQEKIVTIPLGIDPSAIQFEPRPKARAHLISLLGAASAKEESAITLIGSIANLFPEKGLEHFLEAAAEIQNNFPRTLFFVIGEGPQRAHLTALRHHLGLDSVFFFPGSVENAARLLKGFDIFVLPSTKEGLPYVMLEAVASGVPIVATTVGGIPEIAVTSGRVVSIPPGESQRLHEAVASLLAAPLTPSFTPKSLPEEFTLPHMVAKTEALYYAG